ncbi:MAG: hypothetical protein U0802_04330 [Candidatus Binatia bacterium]
MSAGLWTYDRPGEHRRQRAPRHARARGGARPGAAPAPEKLYAAGLYYEYLTDDARLVVKVIKAAATLGAVVANYCAIEDFLFAGERLDSASSRAIS